MKNLKKVLALALAFALSLSLFAGAAFTDQADIDKDYADDVNMLVELGILGGYPDGSFGPNKNITRAEFSKMAYTVKYGYDDQGKLFAGAPSKFTDVEGAKDLLWAKGYINYCSTQNIVGGVGNNKFNPNGNITVAEASKMLLVILGCDPIKEGFGGSNWIGNVVSKAMDLGVFDGWVGDPTAPATRQLVAKLMRNTIFAPIYIYNPITGIGSQVNALDPDVKNETLGEKTMGLKHVEGIVVANERFKIDVDEEGDALEQNASIQSKDKSQVYYQNSKSDKMHILTIDRALDDKMIGTKVDVYFTADGYEGSYTNVKVIGNVITSADTVVYEVNAGDIEFMPNGDSNSSRLVEPYISFVADGNEYKIEKRNGAKLDKVPNNKEYNGKDFADRFFFINDTNIRDAATGTFENPTFDGSKWTSPANFMNDIAKDTMQSYRVVSVDGGDTFSYIFRSDKKELAEVTSYNAKRGTISVSKLGSKDLDDVIIHGEVAKDDDVVIYMENGKPNIVKAETVTGKATIKDDNVAVIGDVEYRADLNLLKDSIAQYFVDHKNNDNTTYTVYNGYILDIDGSSSGAKVEEYAVVLTSSYDLNTDTAKVKLALTDGSEAVYEVDEIDDSKADLKTFDNNGAIGNLYRYNVKNGLVNLFTDDGTDKGTIKQHDTNATKISGHRLFVGNAAYAYDENSTVFFLYGGKQSTDKPNEYTQVKAAVRKLSDVSDMTLAPFKYRVINKNNAEYKESGVYASYLTSKETSIPTLTVGAVTAGEKDPSFAVGDDNSVGYLVEAKYQYNFDTDEWYANVQLIGEDGLVSTRTTDGYYDNGKIGDTPSELVYGSIVEYKLNSDDMIATMELDRGSIKNMQKAPDASKPADGYYYANVTEVRGDLIAFHPYNKTSETRVLTFDDEYKVIAIDDDTFIQDGGIETVSDSETIENGQFNAIIQIKGEKVYRVFSLHNNY